MDCKTAEKLIPDFIKGEMETRAAKEFLKHVGECASCKEELSIQFLVKVGMERLEEGEAFNLNKELQARLATAWKHVRIAVNCSGAYTILRPLPCWLWFW